MTYKPKPKAPLLKPDAVTQDIVAKLWNLCNILKDDAIPGHD
jgi:hypothetical protein